MILCGGSGSRLWPLSRKSFPKQYLSIDVNDNFSFLQKTLNRIKKLEDLDNPIIICNQEHRFITAEQIRNIDIKPKSIILEPTSRNTAPAIAVAALESMKSGKDPILLILPSDHQIKDNQEFLRTIASINNINLDGKTILIATHDVNNLEDKFDEVLCLNKHCCAYGDPSEVLTPEVIEEMYGSHNDLLNYLHLPNSNKK